jgi:3-phenylpropionate/cinnamic acid dioxygenase small subunit
VTDTDRIRDTLTLYVRYADERKSAAWAELFAGAAIFRPRGGQRFDGRPAIKAWFEDLFRRKGAGNRSLHLCGNHVINVGPTAGLASAVSDVVVYERNGDEPWTVYQINRYFDQLVEQDGRWLIADRRIEAW